MNYKQELLFTPEGVRDIYGEECAKRLYVQQKLHETLHLYGFQDIKTPTFEFFDIFNRERGTAASTEMFKFFDRYNNTLVLRPDITPSIARSVAKYYKDDDLQIRLCYVGDTFKNHSNNKGHLKEITQVGAELLNDTTSDADGEMISMTIEGLMKTGLKEFQVDIGHIDFFYGLVEEAGLSEDETTQLKTLLENKNMYGVEKMLASKNISDTLKEMFQKLPEMFGGNEIFHYAKEHVTNERAQKALDRLEKIENILIANGLRDYAIFDLGLLNQYNYYSGIIFKVYTYGTGQPIASGGRYDNLTPQFGKQASAVGVAFVIDQLMNALFRQNIDIPHMDAGVMVLYRSQCRKQAMEQASELREQGIAVRLVRKDAAKEMDDYVAFANHHHISKILHICDDKKVDEISIQ